MRFRELLVHRKIERSKDEWDVNAQLIFGVLSAMLRKSWQAYRQGVVLEVSLGC